MAAKTKNVQVVDKNEGTKIAWKQSGTKLIFGDDDLSIRCDTRQRDWPVVADVCADDDGNLVIGVGVGRYYVAQVEIPPISYIEVEDEDPDPAPENGGKATHLEPLPIDMGEVVLTLWSVDGIPNIVKEDME